MTKSRLLTLAAVAVLGSAAALADDSKKGHDGDHGREAEVQSLVQFDTMTGVPRPYTGATNAIRGVPGGGFPWVLSSARGELGIDGHLEIKVKGLVIDPNDTAAIQAGVAGQNPLGSFAAVVSCLSKDLSGGASTVNLMTQTFPATTGPASSGGGNATIEAWVQLPKPCIAPILFVTSPTGAWFAATGL